MDKSICMEDVIGIHEEDNSSGVGKVLDKPLFCSVQEHHKTMEWDTENGKKEGLTRIQIRGLDKGTIKELIKGYNGEGNVAAYEKLYNDAVW